MRFSPKLYAAYKAAVQTPSVENANIERMCGRVRLSSDYSGIKVRLKFAPNAAAPDFQRAWTKPRTTPILVAIRSANGKRVSKRIRGKPDIGIPRNPSGFSGDSLMVLGDCWMEQSLHARHQEARPNEREPDSRHQTKDASESCSTVRAFRGEYCQSECTSSLPESRRPLPPACRSQRAKPSTKEQRLANLIVSPARRLAE